ncbi:MAG: PQQ-binding-like beta-propeller repeat protein [Alphaproteobacteria bacterium]|nr:PQQ-binding-like beta-propeller repeat protein [Alphaproteobacteria bacterium]
MRAVRSALLRALCLAQVVLPPAFAQSPADWAQWGRTYDGANHSPLTSIDSGTVARLAPVWRVSIEPGLSMPTPLVRDGVMYLHTSPDTLLALDATSGAELWRHVHKPEGAASTMKMGVGLAKDRVFVPTSDLHVLALDTRTGAKIWDHAIEIRPPAEPGPTLGLRSAPLVVGNRVIQGVTTSFVAGGGFIVAMDIESGREIWRFNTIARPGEPGGESWNGLPLEKRSGGSVWHQGTYDPELNLIYYGVAPTYDTGPLLTPSDQQGVTRDALYTNSTIALNPDTGKLVWSYQHMANDQWDLDWVFERQLTSLRINGETRRVVMTIGKMAILDVLDAASGAYLFSIDTGTQNIVTKIDPKTGAKTIDLEKLPDPNRPSVYCPSPSGARSWPATSVSQKTGMVYVPITEWCMRFGPDGYRLLSSGAGLTAADHPDAVKDGMMGRLQSLDLSGRSLGWSVDLAAPISTSTLSTSGGLVFAGDLTPSLKAFDDMTGRAVWSAPLGDYPSSSVISYAVDGRQFVAVVVGMKNNHINDMSRRYAEFMKRQGAAVVAPSSGPAIEVFALPTKERTP